MTQRQVVAFEKEECLQVVSFEVEDEWQQVVAFENDE